MTIGILIMLSLALAFILFFNRSQKKIYQEKMRRQQLQLAHQDELLFSTILAQEEERKRIAKDLHDEIGSKLNVIFLYLHRLKKGAPEQPRLHTTVDEIHNLVDTTIATSRRISHDLLPPTLEKFGLIQAIEELCEYYQRTGAIDMQFEIVEQKIETVPKIVALNLFRILQELISNTMKYANARHINIKLWLKPSQVQIEYRDDGQGFDVTEKANQKGLGMNNIESRMKMIDGQYELQSAPSQGIFVRLRKEES